MPVSRPSFTLSALLVCSAGLVLAACQNAKPGGLYTGTVSSTAKSTTYTVVGAVTEDGAMQLASITASAGTQYGGQITTTRSKTTGTASFRIYDPNGAYVATGSFKGNLGVRSTISGNYTADNGDSGAISLNYNGQYVTPEPLTLATGSYRWTSTRNGQAATLTLGSDGAITGTNEYGCPFTGTASVINDKYDLYTLSLTNDATNTLCNQTSATTGATFSATGAAYSGLAWYTPASGSSVATLTTAAIADAYGTYAIYQKQ